MTTDERIAAALEKIAAYTSRMNARLDQVEKEEKAILDRFEQMQAELVASMAKHRTGNTVS